nr:hypothetical protein Iba_chr12cCG12990 [Ipomoea batatas]
MLVQRFGQKVCSFVPHTSPCSLLPLLSTFPPPFLSSASFLASPSEYTPPSPEALSSPSLHAAKDPEISSYNSVGIKLYRDQIITCLELLQALPAESSSPLPAFDAASATPPPSTCISANQCKNPQNSTLIQQSLPSASNVLPSSHHEQSLSHLSGQGTKMRQCILQFTTPLYNLLFKFCCLRCISDTIMASFSDTSEELAGMLPGVFTTGVAIFVLGNLFPLEPLPPFSARGTFLSEPETCEGCEEELRVAPSQLPWDHPIQPVVVSFLLPFVPHYSPWHSGSEDEAGISLALSSD